YYFDGNITELKSYRRKNMAEIGKVYYATHIEGFKTISEFKFCLLHGGEVQFEWKGKSYTTFPYDGKYMIAEAYKEETTKIYDSPDELLEYIVGGDRLRDVITDVELVERTL
ncbi:MAG: hypothetical protein ACI4RP_09295, partial [Acutalibacteraceae bacterium]